MALKTFNIEESIYAKFAEFCKGHGMSMSRQVQMFMETIMDEDPKAKDEYLKKLQDIRKMKSIHVGTLKDFKKRYNVE